MTKRSTQLSSSRLWVVLDQAVSNATNLVGLAMIGRWLDPDGFGVVALLFTVIPLALLASRGTWGEALLVLSQVRGERDRRRAPVALGGSLLTGLGLSVMAIGAGVVAPGYGATIAVVAPFAPLLLLQDTGRYIRFAEGRPLVAFTSDATWFLVSIGALLLVESWGGGSAALLAAWFAGLVPATAVVLFDFRPTFRGVGEWLRSDRRVWAPLLGDLAGSAGFRALALVVVIAVTGFADGGGFRAAQVAMGPITILTLSAGPLFLYGAPNRSARQTTKAGVVAAALLGGTALGWLVIVVLVPSTLGEMVLGAAWAAAEPLVAPVGLYHVAAASALGGFLGLRAIRRTGAAFAIRLGSGALLVAAAAAGSLLDGARGAAYGMAGVEAATLIVSMLVLHRLAVGSHRTRTLAAQLPVER